MAAHMSDLPSRPSFPVFGLDSTFEGYRWVVLWNSPQHLYTVSLGHGHPEVDSRAPTWLVVSTYAKTPRREIGHGPLISTGPTGYGDALAHAHLYLAERARPGTSGAFAWFREQENNVVWGGSDRSGAPHSHGPEWDAGWTSVDGSLRASVGRRVPGYWARVVDLPTVAVAVTGPESMAGFSAVIDVSAQLAGCH